MPFELCLSLTEYFDLSKHFMVIVLGAELPKTGDVRTA